MLPPKLAEIRDGIEANRKVTLEMVSGLSGEEFAFRDEGEWSVADVLEHLVAAETGTSKVIRKVIKESGGTLPPYPEDDSDVAVRPFSFPPGKVQAPEAAKPRGGKGKEELLDLAARARVQTLLSLAMLSEVDPRSARFPNALFGDLTLYEWAYMILLRHERDHHPQIERILRKLGK